MKNTPQLPPWYTGISRYQWLVLAVASLGWAFDVFEGQIFVASMNEAMPELLPPQIASLDDAARQGYLAFYNNITFASFLLGGAIGGVAFGMLSDRIGRARTMIYTIAMYSGFTFVSALSGTWWHMAIFRFLVAVGVGGEWAVASALVAETFPKRARARSLSIFHATSVLGTLMAVAAGAFIVAEKDIAESIPFLAGMGLSSWRLGFVLGLVPALLIIAVRLVLRSEPEAWQKARSLSKEGEQTSKQGEEKSKQGEPKRLDRFADLFSQELRRHTLVGVGLAAVGLATFWGAHIYGKDVLRQAVETRYIEVDTSNLSREAILEEHFRDIKQWEMLGMLLVTAGGGLGLLMFGPLSERFGRRGAFLFYHLAGLVAALVVFQTLSDVNHLLIFLPVFGFLTLGMHAGYAVYFPELFPTRLRSTGAGFCFNVGRILAAPILFLSGWMQRDAGLSLRDAASLLSLLFVLGAGLLVFARETRGEELPE